MPKENETTTQFKVDISDLKKSMQEAKRAVALANSEFKKVASGMDDWSKSSDGLSAKIKQLDSNLKSQKSILANLEQQYALTVKEMGEGSKAANDLKIKINQQKATINQTERELSGYESALVEVSEAEKKAAKTGKSVADVLDEVDDSAKEASDGFTVLKGSIATFAGNALTGLANGIKSAIGSMVGLADETREYRNEMAKLDTAFTTAGHSTKTAAKTYEELYGVLGDEGQAVEAANFLAKIADNEKDLTTWTKIATGVYGEFGTSLPIESLTEAANETQKTGQITGALADALNWAGVSEESFQESLDKCNSEQERQKLIMDTLNGLYSESAEKYKENNASVIEANKAQADYQNTLASIGGKLEPVMTAVKQGVTGLLQKFLELTEGVDISAFTAKIQEGFTILTDTVLPAVKEGLGWILDNKDTLIAALAGIASGFVAFKVVGIIQGLIGAFKAWKIATEGMTVAQRLLNLVMKANPIGIVVSLIAVIVGALITFIATNDEARAKLKAVWKTIKEFVGKAIKSMCKFFTETVPDALDKMVTFFKELPSKIWTWLVNVVSKITQWSVNMASMARQAGMNFISSVVSFFQQLPSKIWTWLTNVISKVVEWGTNLAQKGTQAAKKLLDAVVEGIKSIPEKVKSIGSDIVKGLWDGINDMTDWVIGKIQGFGESVTSGLKSFFKIGSPSKLMADEIGKWIPEGIAVGINKNAKSVLDSMKNVTATAVGGAKAGISSGGVGAVSGGVVNNFTQIVNSPKQLNRLELYRQSKNLLGFVGGAR